MAHLSRVFLLCFYPLIVRENMLKQIEQQSFLVGGAVRDTLLGINAKDQDWVVVGSTPEAMRQAGFIQVGADFPVFLHPITQQEYALARTERKTGQGYQGFDCDFSSEVTLEQDLLRRDLSINAMALDKNNQLIDPYLGAQDIKKKQLRHVSSAFCEDPLRILRLARFYARFQPLGFSIAAKTHTLCTQMAQQGEMEQLVAERVWQETERALSEPCPEAYFSVLNEMQALGFWFAELEALLHIKTTTKSNLGTQAFMALAHAATLSTQSHIRWAALTHHVGIQPNTLLKTPATTKLQALSTLQARLKVPKVNAVLAAFVNQYHTAIQQVFTLTPSQLLELFNRLDVWRKKEQFVDFLCACQALTDVPAKEAYAPATYCLNALQALQQISAKEFVQQGLTGADIRHKLHQARLERLKQLQQTP